MALSARIRGARAVVVMPVTTPSIKVEAVRYLGGEVVLSGETFDDANAHARTIAAEQGLTFVHPFDDLDVIAGRGPWGSNCFSNSTARWTPSSCRSAAAGWPLAWLRTPSFCVGM
ncbi:MAG: pyridoxal-phosphate dependent enzyme [Hyphomonadaceae bacterium]